jgi:hypothetical protein
VQTPFTIVFGEGQEIGAVQTPPIIVFGEGHAGVPAPAAGAAATAGAKKYS